MVILKAMCNLSFHCYSYTTYAVSSQHKHSILLNLERCLVASTGRSEWVIKLSQFECQPSSRSRIRRIGVKVRHNCDHFKYSTSLSFRMISACNFKLLPVVT